MTKRVDRFTRSWNSAGPFRACPVFADFFIHIVLRVWMRITAVAANQVLLVPSLHLRGEKRRAGGTLQTLVLDSKCRAVVIWGRKSAHFVRIQRLQLLGEASR